MRRSLPLAPPSGFAVSGAMAETDVRAAVARLAAAVMAVDGRIVDRELEAADRLKSLGLGGLEPLIFDELERTSEPIDVGPACEALRGIHPDAAATLLGLLAQIAASDGRVSREEHALLDTIAAAIGLGDEHAAAEAGRAVPGHPAWATHEIPVAPTPESQTSRSLGHACRVLGVAPSASRDEIDVAYLALVERYDPHKVAGLGAEFAALAVRKLFEITLAFEALVGTPGAD